MRVIVDGSMYELSEDIPMEKNIKHNIDIVVDRLVVKPGIEKRLTDSLENGRRKSLYRLHIRLFHLS